MGNKSTREKVEGKEKKLSLTIFMPAFNEEKNIKLQVENILKYLSSKDFLSEFQIVVVNDGSSDNTRKVVEKNFKDNKHVKIYDNDNEVIHSYGSALRKGFSVSTNLEWVFFTDSDNQFVVEDLDKFFDIIAKKKGIDYIIGYRAPRHDPFIRLLNAKVYNLMVQLLIGVHVRDIDCAFKLFKSDVIKSINIVSNSALINTEILYKLKLKGYKYVEVPVTHKRRVFGKATGAKLSVILKAIMDLFKLKFGQI